MGANAAQTSGQEFTQDLLGDGDGGGQSAANAGQAGSGGQAGAAGGTGATSAGSPSWREQIPEEFKDAGWLQNVNDIPTLVKNYANAQKMIGAEKIPLPGPNATPDEIRGVLSRIGLPAKLEEYKVVVPKEFESAIDPEFVKGYSKLAHEAGLLPNQASKVIEFLAKMNDDGEKAAATAYQTQIKQNQDSLKQEWGTAFKDNIARAKAAVKQFGGDDALKYLRERGLSNDPVILKLLAKAGEALGEDLIRGEGGGDNTGITQTQAREKLAEMKSQGASHPYYDEKHPNHAAARAEARKWYAAAFPEATA